jgi:hypothetical protein
VHVDKKMKLVFNRAVALGITNPSEKSYAHLVAVIVYGDDLAWQPDRHLSLVRNLKAWFKSLHRLRSQNSFRIWESLPESPEEYKAKFPIAYEAAFRSNPPVQAPGDESRWRITEGLIPCRSTRSGIQQHLLPLACKAYNAAQVVSSVVARSPSNISSSSSSSLGNMHGDGINIISAAASPVRSACLTTASGLQIFATCLASTAVGNLERCASTALSSTPYNFCRR